MRTTRSNEPPAPLDALEYGCSRTRQLSLMLECLTRIVRISSDPFIGVLPGVQRVRHESLELLNRLAPGENAALTDSAIPGVKTNDLVRALVRACDAGTYFGIADKPEGEALVARLLAPDALDAAEMKSIVDAIRARIAGNAMKARGHVTTESALGEFGIRLAPNLSPGDQEAVTNAFVAQLEALGCSRIFQILPSTSERKFRNDAIYVFGKVLSNSEVSISVVELWSPSSFKAPFSDSLIRELRPEKMENHAHDDDRVDISYPFMQQITLSYPALSGHDAKAFVARLVEHLIDHPRIPGFHSPAPGEQRVGHDWAEAFGCVFTYGGFPG